MVKMQGDHNGTRSVAVDPDWLVASLPVSVVAQVARASFVPQEDDAGLELEVVQDAFSRHF